MDQASCLGAPALFEFNGIQYKVSERTFEHEAMFCQWVKKYSMDEIERLKDDMPLAFYKMQVDGWRHDCAMGLYQWGMPFVTIASIGPAGSKYLALLALAQLDRSGNVTPMLIEAIYKDAKGAWDRLCAIMGDLNDPPKPKAEPAAESP